MAAKKKRRITEGFRNLREALGAVIGRLVHDKPRVATEERASTRLTELTQVRAALAEAEARSEERRLALESHIQDVGFMRILLRVRNARIAALEKEVSDLGGALARRNDQSGEVKSDSAFLNDTIAALTATVAERDASIAALKAMKLAESETLAGRQSDFTRAIAETEVQRNNLGTLEAALAAANTRLAEDEAAALAALELHNSMEAALGEERQQVARLEVDLAGVVRDRDASVAAAAAVQAEHLEQGARLATASARVLELEAEALDHVHAITALQEEPRVSLERSRDLEGELHAAEDSIRRLEADLRVKIARLDELVKVHDDSRGTSATHEVVPEGAVPLFIRTGESEVVHVLGRKTTIGRTPENDVQIDAQYISRHHAVILAERTHAIIEDLNSTNGVIVNGRRVLRQTLKDGDIVLIGTAPFRFAVRPMTERR